MIAFDKETDSLWTVTQSWTHTWNIARNISCSVKHNNKKFLHEAVRVWGVGREFNITYIVLN